MASSKSNPSSPAGTMHDMLALVAQRKPAAAPTPEASTAPEAEAATETPVIALAPPTAAPPAPTPVPEPEANSKGRKEAAPAEPAGRIDYAGTFLHRGREKKGKAVYITEDAHRTLSAIIQASDGTGLADLLANIITHHFETYGPDIRTFIAEQEKKNKKRLLI